MAHHFGESIEPSAITVVRRNQYTTFPGPPGAKDIFEMVMPESAARRVSLVMVAPGAKTTTGAAEHSGEEIIFGLEGQTEVSFADRTITIAEGDCVHFDGHLKHSIRKVGSARTRALVIRAQDPRKGSREPCPIAAAVAAALTCGTLTKSKLNASRREAGQPACTHTS